MTDFFTWLEVSALATWVREAPTIWAYATVLTLHTFGMGVLVGASTVLSLRLLGVGGAMPLAPMRLLFRVVWVGFWVNLATGTLLFMADATTRGTQLLFIVKLMFVAVGVASVVQIERRLYSANTAPAAVSGTVRGLAFLSLVAWVVAITAGRLLAYVR
jgi:uncharacterized membrane protein